MSPPHLGAHDHLNSQPHIDFRTAPRREDSLQDLPKGITLPGQSKPPVIPPGGQKDQSADPSLSADIPVTGQRIHELLFAVAQRVAKARGYAAGVAQVSFMVPAEVVAYALGVHRSTLYRHLPRLQDAGLVDYRAHRTTYNGRTVADGTVWSVKVSALCTAPARVRLEDLQHQWRDLGADVERGRTAYQQVRQSISKESSRSALEVVLGWSLPPHDQEGPLPVTVAPGSSTGVEVVLDVPFAPLEERGDMVDLAARAAAAHLGDDSINFYRWLLWQLLRLHDRGQDYFEMAHLMIRRAGVDRSEGFARSAGALLVSRLKAWDAWELIRTAPQYRVGTAPRS